MITVGAGRQIRWASTLFISGGGDGEPGSVWFILVDVSTGQQFAYNAYSAEANAGDILLSRGATGQADTRGVDAFFDRITTSARMENIP